MSSQSWVQARHLKPGTVFDGAPIAKDFPGGRPDEFDYEFCQVTDVHLHESKTFSATVSMDPARVKAVVGFVTVTAYHSGGEAVFDLPLDYWVRIIFEPGDPVILHTDREGVFHPGDHAFVKPSRHSYASIVRHVESDTTFHILNRYIAPKEGD